MHVAGLYGGSDCSGHVDLRDLFECENMGCARVYQKTDRETYGLCCSCVDAECNVNLINSE